MTMAGYSLYHNANFQSFVSLSYQPRPAKEKYAEIRVEAQLQHIRDARKKEKSATVYAGDYRRKELDDSCQSSMRPSSPTRMNKPHPPEVFLFTTLHNIPGHYNCKKNISLEEKGEEQTNISPTRPKKLQRGDKTKVQIFNDVNSNMAAQAWLKLANVEDYSAVMNMIKFVSDKQAMSEDPRAKKNLLNQALEQYMKLEYVPSAQRWLLNARPEEGKAMERLLRTLSTGPPTAFKGTSGSYPPDYRPQKKEYLIHPDWRAQK
ncbi:uncharacterized protein LOC143792044 isoform X1 [Ranitomeya variabilis]|uniref:uncharacterized protein LOC143792044 isoform X1 n=1 Tax=Ranitomeya variabilis TaxID=490064 RepID=UPI004057A9FC